MAEKIYMIEYGRTHAPGGKRGEDYHISRPLTKKQAESRLKKLNKSYAYTTVLKLKNGRWDPLG